MAGTPYQGQSWGFSSVPVQGIPSPPPLVQVANVLEFEGADPTGVADSTAAIMAAYNSLPIAGLPGQGGAVYLPAGTYRVSSTLQFNAVAPVYFRGDGPSATIIEYTGSGDAVSMFNNYQPGSGPILVWGGGVSNMTIDGTNAAAGAVGLHCGDMKYGEFRRLQIQNFTGTPFNGVAAVTGGIGMWIDNRKFYTEDCTFEAHLSGCTHGAVIDVTTSSKNAHDNCTHEFSLAGPGGGWGVILQNNPNCYHSKMRIHGGIASVASVATQNYFLALANIGGSSASFLSPGCTLEMAVESDGGLASTPGMILTQANCTVDATGMLDFQTGHGVPSSISAAAFKFTGPVSNDTGITGLTAGVTFNAATTNNRPPQIMCVEGNGTTTAIAINGVTIPGVTSGVFYLPAGATYQISDTGAHATVTMINALPA